MPTPPPQQPNPFFDAMFPIAGVDVSQALEDQAPGTTPLGVNVRTFEPQTLRGRGGSRNGLVKFFPKQPAGNHPIQMLAIVVDPSANALLIKLPPGTNTIPDPSNNGRGTYYDGTPIVVPIGGTGIPISTPSAVKVKLTITANDQNKSQGAEFDFTGNEFTEVGLLPGDSITSVDISSTGQPGTAPAGTYDIAVGNAQVTLGSSSHAYDIVYVPGTMTVGGGGGIAFVQVSQSGLHSTSFTHDVVEGDLLLALVQNTADTPLGLPGDNRGNVWTQAHLSSITHVSHDGLTTPTCSQALWYAIAKDSGPCTVTLAGDAVNTHLFLIEYSGVDPSTPLDSTAGVGVYESLADPTGVPAIVVNVSNDNSLVFLSPFLNSGLPPFGWDVVPTTGFLPPFNPSPPSGYTVITLITSSSVTYAFSQDQGGNPPFDFWGTSLGASFKPGFSSPTIASVDGTGSNPGNPLGGDAVTITGTSFTDNATVTFGGIPATDVVVNSSTSLTCKSPACGVGGTTDQAVNVIVTTYDQHGLNPVSSPSVGSTWTYVAPVITGIFATHGPFIGGTAITITGSNFYPGTKVTVGSRPGASVTITSLNQINLFSPKNTPPPSPTGSVIVDVTAACGTLSSAITVADQFTYSPPVVSGLTPSTGPAAGGTPVLIGGDNFGAGATVFFGGVKATHVVVGSIGSISCQAPPGTGTVLVQVFLAGSNSSGILTPGVNEFTYT